MRSSPEKILAALALLAGLARAEAPRGPVTLLILPFDAASADGGAAPLSEGVPDLVTAFLAGASDRIAVVDRQSLEEVAAEAGLNMQLLRGPGALKHLGQLPQARYILRGSVAEAGGELRLQAFLHETETTRLVKTFQARGPARELLPLCERLAADAAGYFSAGMAPLPPLPADQDPALSLHLIRGLGHHHQGQHLKAVPEFMKVLQKDPGNADAKYWLGASFAGAGWKDHAVLELEQFLARFPRHARALEARKTLGNLRSKGAEGEKK